MFKGSGKWIGVLLTAALTLTVLQDDAHGHFGMVMPADNMGMQGDPRGVVLTLSLSHPMEGMGMDLERPAVFEVTVGDVKKDLRMGVKEIRVMGHKAWQARYRIRRPGVYIFHMEPTPYWEPAEDCYIIHYTKTVVAAFGDEEGWDRELGLKTEIVPLTRPFGLYSGNVFQGIVKLGGQPVPFARVEVEYYNRDGKAVAPTDYMITQTLKADQNGVFTYAVPRPGWWGFAALNTSPEKRKHKGEEKDVELGAVLWVKFEAWQEK
ncbi:MAG: DUF4198 domain-containing protein [Deltaproteobacteria bacterium]|nr:MAG: DUF4198 domain-containing protein [Deltaproteobacteria bacterium]